MKCERYSKNKMIEQDEYFNKSESKKKRDSHTIEVTDRTVIKNKCCDFNIKLKLSVAVSLCTHSEMSSVVFFDK